MWSGETEGGYTCTPGPGPSYFILRTLPGPFPPSTPLQALVTQDCSPVALLNAVKAAKGCLKIYAGLWWVGGLEERVGDISTIIIIFCQGNLGNGYLEQDLKC